jgi:excisionase family DNA binding protein
MSEQTPQGYLTYGEAAALAGASTKTIQRRVLAGELTAYRLTDARRRYFLRDDVLALTAPRPLN